MNPALRSAFNRAFTPELYAAYQADLSATLSCDIGFRLAETPVFLPADLRRRCETAGREVVAQLCEPARLEKMKKAIPSRWNAPGFGPLPQFTQVDFAVVRDGHGELAPKLIELQGFPSLTAFEVVQRDAWARALRTIPGLDAEWTCWFSELAREEFLDLARRAIAGDRRPENVILMDLDPPSQKTYPDFAATKKFFDIDSVCPTTLERDGRRLLRRIGASGRAVAVERIYNRVVFDELEKKGWKLPFDFRDEIDVEWSPHPNWYWVWSKYSLPFLDHPAVPKATLLSELAELPADLSRHVLKPLFSFAGGGVNVDPSREDILRIPDNERDAWCLQEKIEYAPAIAAPDGGGIKAEIRLMFLRPDREPVPILAQNLVRLSRGKMLGVDFNKDFDWVGSSIGIWPRGQA